MITKDEIMDQVWYAFRERAVTSGFVGGKLSKAMAQVMFDDFKKNLEWRIDNLFKKDESVSGD